MSTVHNPYVGPRPFSRDEKLYGRDHEALELADQLISERIVLLYSPSGAGKTSLIEARLKPVLEEEGFRILPTLRVGQHAGNGAGRLNGQNRYVLSALSTLAEELGRKCGAEHLEERTFSGYLTELEGLSYGQPPGGGTYELLIFDQFEEVFTTGSLDLEAEKERRTFFWELGEVLKQRHRWALFAMREDYIARLDPYAHTIPTRFANTFRLDLLRRPNAAAAIQGPAADNGIEITDGAVDRLITDLSKVRSNGVEGVQEHTGLHVEPVQLQVVCHRLWQRLESSGELEKTHRIDEEQVADTVADIDRTLGDYYAETVRNVAGRTGSDERTIRAWFESQLITSGGIRKQVQEGPVSGEAGREVLRGLANAFLVRPVTRGGATWYELAHDRLVQPVRNDNARWEEENLSLLQRTSEDWNHKNRSEDLLLRGDALKEEERWAAANEERLSVIDREFLEACLKARHVSRRAKRLKTLLAAVAAAALLAMSILYRMAGQAAKTAQGTRLTYLPHALLLGAEKAQGQRDDSLSALLAVQAYRFREDFLQPDLDPKYGKGTIATDKLIDGKSVYEALADAISERYFGHVFHDHEGAVRTVAFSPEGTLLASGDAEGTVLLWSLKKPFQKVGSLKDLGEVRSLAFSPDGLWLAAGLRGESGNVVRLWPIRNGVVESEPVANLPSRAAVRSVLFRPAASPSMLVAVDDDEKLVGWQLAPEGWNKEPLWDLPMGKERKIGGVAFSPDGGRLACGAGDGIYLWSLDAGDPRGPGEFLQAKAWTQAGIPKVAIRAVAFGPLGLAAAGPVGGMAEGPGETTVSGVTLFDLDGREKESWSHTSEVRSLAYVGTDLLVGSTAAGEVVLWDFLHDGHEPTILTGQRSWVSQVASGPEGRFVASGGSDKMVRLWERLDLKIVDEPLATGAAVRAIAISPKESLSSRWVAAGLEDGVVELYPLEDDGSLGELPSPLDPSKNGARAKGVRALSFDPSGAWLAAVDADQTVRVWDLNQHPSAPQEVLPSWAATLGLPDCVPQESSILSWKPSSDRRWLAVATGSEDQPWATEGHLQVWNLKSEPGKGVDDPLFDSPNGKTFSSVAWSGDRLAAGNWDGMVRIWDFEAERFSKAPLKLDRDYGGVVSVSWTDDGKLLASGHSLGTVLVWEAKVPDSEPIVFEGHEKKVYAVAFGDNGHLYSGGEDGTLRTWKLTSTLVDEACRIVGRNLSPEECEPFVESNEEAYWHPACLPTQPDAS